MADFTAADVDRYAQRVMGHPDMRAAVRTVLAALAEDGRLRPANDWMRVIVVLDHHPRSRYGFARVHDVTTDQEQAQRWVREIASRYDPADLSATQTVAVVYRNGQPETDEEKPARG